MISLFRAAMPLLVVAFMATYSSPAASQARAQQRPSASQIRDACLKVELPAALKKLGLGPIRTREDASDYAQGKCQLIVQICTADPTGDDCQRPLAVLGLSDPGYVPSSGASLYNAAEAGATTTVSKLLASGADPNWRNAGGWTPLMIAAAERHLDTVIVLLKAKADPNARNALGRTALMFASGYGQDAIVERLLAAGADPNIVPKDPTGWTALIGAAARGNARTVELLLRGGADPTIKTKDGQTALEIASSEGHAEVVRVLQQDGAKASSKAPAGSKMDALNRMLDSGVSPNQELQDGSTLLTSLVTEGDQALVERLLERRADVNAKGKNGIFPLIAVFTTPLLQTPLGLLMAKQANAPKELIEVVQTMRGKWNEIALLLINKGADININAPTNGMTPLHYAAFLDYRDVADVLLAKGMDINAKDAQNATPLYFAIMADNSDMVSKLLDKGADNNAAGIVGVTPLHLAVASGQDKNGKPHGSKKTAGLLIIRGADINAKTKSGNTPLHLVAKFTGEAEMAKLLIERGAQVNALDDESHTPLFYATEQDNMEVANILIKHDALK